MESQTRRITNIAGQALIGLAAIIVILSIRSTFASASTGAITDFANECRRSDGVDHSVHDIADGGRSQRIDRQLPADPDSPS